MSNFSLEDRSITQDGKYVLRTGKIFEAGKYPDKGFEISKEEIRKAVEEFQPVDLDIEHMITAFDGKLGKLHSVEVNEDGEMFGGALIPRAVDELLGGKYKVSTTWGADKKIKGLAIVTNPRVSDAALFAAHTFSIEEKGDLDKFFADSAQTWEGRSAIQQVHDVCSGKGAICDEENTSQYPNYYYSEKDESLVETIGFVSKDESKNIQKLHDAAVKAGAKCSFVKQNNFSKGATSGTPKMEKKIMTTFKEFKDAFIGLLKSVPEDEGTVTEQNTQTENQFSAADAELKAKLESLEAKLTEFAAKDAEIALVKAELQALKTQNKQAATDEVADYVKGLVGKKIVPAQEAAVVALFKGITEDDAKNEYTFSIGDEKFSRVELLKNILGSFANLPNTEEVVFSGKVLGTTDKASELKVLEQRTRELATKANATIKK